MTSPLDRKLLFCSLVQAPWWEAHTPLSAHFPMSLQLRGVAFWWQHRALASRHTALPFHHQWPLPWQPENQVSDQLTLVEAWLSDFTGILQICPFIWHPISDTPSSTTFWLPDATLLHFSTSFTFPLKLHSFLKLLKLLKHIFLHYFLLVLILSPFLFLFFIVFDYFLSSHYFL